MYRQAGKKKNHYTYTVTKQTNIRGYSLYSRLVSSILVWTPFPRGTCTPFKVTVAFGSGAVLPKPVIKKNPKVNIIKCTHTHAVLKTDRDKGKYFLLG